MSQSEVARIRQQIEEECQAMKRAMEAPAMTASHRIIQHRYNALGAAQERLAAIVGEKEAAQVVVDEYCKIVG